MSHLSTVSPSDELSLELLAADDAYAVAMCDAEAFDRQYRDDEQDALPTDEDFARMEWEQQSRVALEHAIAELPSTCIIVLEQLRVYTVNGDPEGIVTAVLGISVKDVEQFDAAIVSEMARRNVASAA